ncbi:hypothetical protein B1L11_36530 [Microbispora sp. GKU 823]|nr:hypothetical protein B1L11_36530 [Microbispora sp. GKU 823]
MDSGPPLRDIGCFALVARHLSFSRAAAELGVSQPAASQAVGRLERALGVRLFERTSREVRLSPAGKALLPYAEALLESGGRLLGGGGAARGAGGHRCPPRLSPAGRRPRGADRAQDGTPRSPCRGGAAPGRPAAAVAALAAGEVTAAILAAPFPRELTTAARFHVPVGHLAVPAGDPLAGLPACSPNGSRGTASCCRANARPAGCGHGSPPASGRTGSTWWPTRSTTSPPRSTWSRPASACCPPPPWSSRPSAGTTSPSSPWTRVTFA